MDDLEFIQNCVKGDKQSWDQFIDKYSRLIYSYIHNILKVKGYAFAQNHTQDIFQEILCSLINDNFKKLRSFKSKNGCSLASWLRQVTINSTIDYMRKVKPLISIDEENEEGFSLKEILFSKTPDIPDAVNYKERTESLKDCIEELDNDDKYFLELYMNQGLKLEELKEIFKLSRGAIDMQKSRIINRLKECFKSKGFVFI